MMKKQILTLSVCLALSATAVMAAPATTVAPAAKAPVVVKTVTTKTVVVKTPGKTVVVKKCAKKVVVKTATPATVAVSPEELAKQKFEERMAQERDSFYNKVGLTAEQKAKAEQMDKANREAATPLFNEVRTQKAKLHQLQAKKAGFVAICKQKHQVKLAKKALRAHMEASRKQFESILTKDQLAKLKTMKPCNCAGPCKCHKHHHGHHAHEMMGPKPFGPAPVATPAPVAPAVATPAAAKAPKCNCKK